MIDVEFLGGANSVTGSAFLFEKDSLKWLVDCGMFQGTKEHEERNRDVWAYKPSELSFIFLTHAHIDHSGLIPKLVKEGFRGRVLCTQATVDLCNIMLQDSGHIQEMEAEWRNRKARRLGRKEIEPLYTIEDAKNSLQYFQTIEYGKTISIEDGIKVKFLDAGHILGSSIIEFWLMDEGKERKLVFSGDLGGLDQPLVRDPSIVEEANILWLESTYGNRLHKSRRETVEEFLEIIKDAIKEKGKVIIPAFAVEKAQDIIYTIGQFIREGFIPEIPVYIDSPLAISATEIFKKNSECFDEETKRLILDNQNPLEPSWLIYTKSIEESKAINEDLRPGVIISASGMCDSGRIKHHLKHHLWQKNSHIVFVGYQAEGTSGRRIIDGAKSIKLFGEEIAVKAHIHTLGGFSAHADQKGLIEWLSNFKNPDLKVFLVHGEEKIQKDFSKAIQERLDLEVYIPEWRERITLFGDQDVKIYKTTKNEKVDQEIHQESFSFLLKNLDKNYKRLKRRLKKLRSNAFSGDHWIMEELGDLNKRIERLHLNIII